VVKIHEVSQHSNTGEDYTATAEVSMQPCSQRGRLGAGGSSPSSKGLSHPPKPVMYFSRQDAATAVACKYARKCMILCTKFQNFSGTQRGRWVTVQCICVLRQSRPPTGIFLA